MNPKLKFVLIGSLSLLMMACSSGNEKEVKDLSDILPESERNYDQVDTLEMDNADTLDQYQEMFASLGELDSILPYDEDLFPDRFGPESMEKFRLNLDGEEIVYVKWRFADSTLVDNALFNWLDCFGKNCNSIRVSEESNLQRNAFQVLANDTVLIYLESKSRLNDKLWDKHFESLKYELDWNYRMEQSPRGKVRWFTYIDEEKTPLKKEAV